MTEKKSKNFYFFLIITVLAFLTAFILEKLSGVSSGASAGQSNPYQYDLAKLKQVPAALVKYEEVRTIKIALSHPRYLALDSSGRIYVSGAGGLLVFDQNGEPGVVRTFTAEPGALTIAENGVLYLSFPGRIAVYSNSGVLQRSWSLPGQGWIITALALSGKYLFVADAGNRVIWKFDLEGKLQGVIGGKDDQVKGGGPLFIVPSPYFDMLADKSGSLWVANPGRHKMEEFTVDGSMISQWGKASMAIDGFCGCCNPVAIAKFADGSLVTAEKGLVRVKKYDVSGRLLAVVATPAQFKEEAILDLAVDAAGRVLVLDRKAGLIRVFRSKETK